jgi:DNA modification methylase
MHADARSENAYSKLIGSEGIRLMFADPPYNVPINGHITGLGSIKHQEFAMASGEMSSAQFVEFLRTVLLSAAGVSLDGAIHFVCMDWRHLEEALSAGKLVYSELKNLCVWNKDNGGMGSFYRSKHELILVCKIGNAPHTNTIELGQHGRYRTNVWDYAGVNTMRAGRLTDLAMHPTVKPVALVIDAIKDWPHRNDIVFDPFCGFWNYYHRCGKIGTSRSRHRDRRSIRRRSDSPLAGIHRGDRHSRRYRPTIR